MILTNRFLTPALALLCCALPLVAGVGSSQADDAKTRVVLLPATVFSGRPENGKALTVALRESLEKHGFDVVPAEETDAAIRAAGLVMTRRQPISALSNLKGNLKAAYLVYPQVLTVGVGAAAKVLQANLLVNVVGKPKGDFVHTRQIGQEFQVKEDAEVIIPAPAAAEAAGKLLDGFYEKAK